MRLRNILFFLVFVICTVIITYFPTIKYELLPTSREFSTHDKNPNLDYFLHTPDISINIAKNAMVGKYEFQDKKCYFPIIENNLTNIFSNQNQFANNTHELYANSLSILFDLTDAYITTKNQCYIDKGMQIITQWYKYNKRFQIKRSYYSWYNHSTALRAIAILYFLDNQPNPGLYKNGAITSILNSSINYLLNPNNYAFKGNHGIFQDIALLYLINHIKNDTSKRNLKIIPIERFENQIDSSFSEDGIHFENSPHYHFVVVCLMKSFISLTSLNELSLSTIQIFEKSIKNREIIVLHNKTLPEIGDTDKAIVYPDVQSVNGELLSPESGFYIKKTLPEIYFLARTQSPLINHKHNDVSSFILWLDNEKIISETGFLDYSQSDDRKLTKSKLAHNVIFTNDESQLSIDTGLFKDYISESKNIFLSIDVTGETEYHRKFIYNSSSDVFIIADYINNNDSVEQIFHFPNSLKSIKKLDSIVKIETSNNVNYFISCYNNELKLIYGVDKLIPSFQAEPYDNLYPSYSIIQKKRSSEELILVISKDSPAIINAISDSMICYSKNDSINSLKINSHTIDINKVEYPKKSVDNKITNAVSTKLYWISERIAFKLIIILLIFSSIYYLIIPIQLRISVGIFNKYEFYFLFIPFFLLGFFCILLKLLWFK